MNLIMAAVGVLVMFKTMLHTAFRNIDEEFEASRRTRLSPL